MKTILVPTDYSPVASNATRYAFELSNHLNAKIILFHAYRLPILLSSLPLLSANIEFEIKNLNELKAEEFNLKKDIGLDVEIESIVYNGTAIEGIIDVIKQKNIDYVVMGITGESKLEEILLGSTTISVINNSKTPVFIIPEKAKFKKIDKIVFVHPSSKHTPENVLEELRLFCHLFDSELIIYKKSKMEGVENSNEVKTIQENEFNKSGIKNVNSTLTLSEDEDIAGINNFIDFNKADLAAMIPSTSKSFAAIFKRDKMEKMAFHTHIPLLILHDINEE